MRREQPLGRPVGRRGGQLRSSADGVGVAARTGERPLLEVARASDLLVLDANGYRALGGALRPAGKHPDLHLAPCPVVITPDRHPAPRATTWATTQPG